MGTITVINNFEMPQLNRNTTIRIYLPNDYDINNKNYPVMYMHDGQNIFDKKDSAFNMSWDVHTTLDKLQCEEKSQGMIVVGIDNNTLPGKRLDEYSPWINDWSNLNMKYTHLGPRGGQGKEYGEFIVNTLKPYIDENYRTLSDRENTLVAGSSMGGLISLFIGIEYQDVFSKVGAFSTAAWFAEENIFSYIKEKLIRKDMKFYLDIGTNETSDATIKEFCDYYLNDSKNIVQILREKGFNNSNLEFVIEDGAVHNELAWNRRFPHFLEWIMKK